MKKDRKSGRIRWELPTEEEVEVASILCALSKSWMKSLLNSKRNFEWGVTKKRSVLDSTSESFVQEEKSPTTPLCFLPSGSSSGSDGSDKGKGKAPLYDENVSKRKGTDDLMETCNKMQQEQDKYMKKLKCMETLDEEFTHENLEPKAKGKMISYPWNSVLKASDQQCCPEQVTILAPGTPQLVLDPTRVASSSTNSNVGGGYGLFNQIDPHVNIRRETYDFMGCSQPFDQSKNMVMDNDLKVKAAAAARKRRTLKIQENRKLLLAKKLSRSGK